MSDASGEAEEGVVGVDVDERQRGSTKRRRGQEEEAPVEKDTFNELKASILSTINLDDVKAVGVLLPPCTTFHKSDNRSTKNGKCHVSNAEHLSGQVALSPESEPVSFNCGTGYLGGEREDEGSWNVVATDIPALLDFLIQNLPGAHVTHLSLGVRTSVPTFAVTSGKDGVSQQRVRGRATANGRCFGRHKVREQRLVKALLEHLTAVTTFSVLSESLIFDDYAPLHAFATHLSCVRLEVCGVSLGPGISQRKRKRKRKRKEGDDDEDSSYDCAFSALMRGTHVKSLYVHCGSEGKTEAMLGSQELSISTVGYLTKTPTPPFKILFDDKKQEMTKVDLSCHTDKPWRTLMMFMLPDAVTVALTNKRDIMVVRVRTFALSGAPWGWDLVEKWAMDVAKTHLKSALDAVADADDHGAPPAVVFRFIKDGVTRDEALKTATAHFISVFTVGDNKVTIRGTFTFNSV